MLKHAPNPENRLRGLVPAALAAVGLTLAAGATAGTPDPYLMANHSWITISGEVESVNRNSFSLDYGDGTVLVEMDDGDRDADAYKLLAGDKVTVSGRIDDDFFETTSIEAGSVFVENIGTTFFASSLDEETTERLVGYVVFPVPVSVAVVQGTVEKVGDREFVVDAGNFDLSVAVDQMPYNPIDDEGYQKIDVGDRVKVTGKMDHGLFDGRELVAQSVIELSR